MQTLNSFQTALLALGASIALVATPLIALRVLRYLVGKMKKSWKTQDEHLPHSL